MLTTLVTALLVLPACLAYPEAAYAKEINVGVNPRTGAAISMPIPAKHPVLLMVGNRNPFTGLPFDPATDAAFQKTLAEWQKKVPLKTAIEQFEASIEKSGANKLVVDMGAAVCLGRGKLIPTERFTALMSQALDKLLAEKRDNTPDYYALFNLTRRYGNPAKDVLSKHGTIIKNGMFPGGKLDVSKASIEAHDLICDLGVMSEKEKQLLTTRLLGAVAVGRDWGCNNGRWGWFCYATQAAVLENPELMKLVLEDVQHWLGHDIYPDGGGHDNVSYDYCHGARPTYFESIEPFLTGYRMTDFAVPSMPERHTTNRDGFEDPTVKDMRKDSHVAWRTGLTYANWKINRAAPDGSLFARGDTHPDGVANPDETNYHTYACGKLFDVNVPLLSEDLISLAVLRGGGPAEDYDQGLRGAPSGRVEKAEMLFACLDGAATDPCHNHMNMLQLVIWGKGKWLAEDNGCRVNWLTGTYDRELGTYGYKTYAHNTVTVDQQPQFISNSKKLFFGDQPGFRVAAMDAGYVYRAVSHQRTVAMTDRYLLDMNLLPPRAGAAATEMHTFDYMLSGTGEFLQNATKINAKEDRRNVACNGSDLDEYLQWPNIDGIYPFIRWYAPLVTSNDWEVTWGLKTGPFMRVMVFNDKRMNVAYGMANLGIRGPYTFQTQCNGVPKLMARQSGPGARFLVLLEPYKEKTGIAAWTKLDDQAAKIMLADGATDYVLLQRASPSYAFLRVKDGKAQSARFFEGTHLKMGGKSLLAGSAPVQAAGVEFRGNQALVAATADKPCRLTVACSGDVKVEGAVKKEAEGFSVELQAGRNRIAVNGTGLTGPALADAALANLVADLPARPAAEVDTYYAQDKAKRLWSQRYMWPQIFHDGAYKGQKGTDSHWSVDVTDDGKVVAGTHFGTVECLDKNGNKLWIYQADGRCACNCGWDAWYQHNPLHIKSDGSRVLAGSEFGVVHCLDGDGRYLWKTALGAKIRDICPDSTWSKFAVATVSSTCILDANGKKVLEVPHAATRVKLADSGAFAICGNAKFDWPQELLGALAANPTAETSGALVCFDAAGKELWKHYAPGFGDWAGDPSLEALAGPLSGHRFLNIAMTPDGKRVLAGSSNTRLYCFDGATGKETWKTDYIDAVAWACQIAADGNTAAMYDMGGVLACFDGNGKQLWRYRTPFGGYFMDMTPDGQRMSAANATGSLVVLSRDGKLVTRTPVMTVEPMVTAISPNGRYTAVGGVGYDVQLFENEAK